MKHKPLFKIFLLFILAVQGYAVKAQSKSDDCGDKNEAVYTNCKSIDYKHLPEEVKELMLTNGCDVTDESSYNYGFSFDLNNDEKNEYLFCCLEFPHGPCAANLYSRINNKWEIILTTNGYNNDCDKVLTVLNSMNEDFYDLCIENEIIKFIDGKYRPQ